MISTATERRSAARNENDENLLTPREAAKLLKVSLSTIWRWKGKKIIPYYEFGGIFRKKIRFDRYELLAFGKKNSLQSTSKSSGGHKNEG
jgi:excisionase family DNA binding protein